MDSTVDIILHEMRVGFDAINRRLDAINGTVRKHGEQLAVFESQQIDDRLEEITSEFITHRARCPFDANHVAGAGKDAVTANDQLILTLAKRIRRNQGIAAASIGGAGALAAVELLPRILDWLLRRP